MPMEDKPKPDKAEENAEPKSRRKPLEYRRFEKLLKHVIKSPPMKSPKPSQ
jgi:hypothetical protein